MTDEDCEKKRARELEIWSVLSRLAYAWIEHPEVNLGGLLVRASGTSEIASVGDHDWVTLLERLRKDHATP